MTQKFLSVLFTCGFVFIGSTRSDASELEKIEFFEEKINIRFGLISKLLQLKPWKSSDLYLKEFQKKLESGKWNKLMIGYGDRVFYEETVE